jgi:hypothetical protein
MRQAGDYERLNKLDAFYDARRRVIELAVPLLEQTVSIGTDTMTLISALTDLGSRPRAVKALEVAEHVLATTDSTSADAIRRLIDETRNGPLMPDGEARDVCLFYACQACGRLHGWLGTGCPSCGFLPQTPREFAIATRAAHPVLDMGLVVSLALRIKAGEKLADFVENLDDNVTEILANPDWPGYFEQLKRDEQEEGVDWLLTLPEVSCCPTCQASLEDSGDVKCHQCGLSINFPPMQRGLIAADHLIGLVEDFILLDPTDQAKQMLSSLIHMRDRAFFYQALPSVENLVVFRNFWDKQVDLWDWGLEYTFRVRDGQLVDSHNKGASNEFKDAQAARFVRELGQFSQWLYHEAAIT